MGLLKNARQRGREAGLSDPQPGAEPARVFYDLRGVRFERYRKPAGEVNVTRLAANDGGTWAQVWRCIKRSRPQLAALLMDPQLAALQTAFNCEGVYVDFTQSPEVEIDMHIEAHYIDTRDGANSPFTPPPEVDDYAAWLRGQYTACQSKDGDRVIYCGLAQRVNALVQQVKTAQQDKAEPIAVRVIGPHAAAVRDFLRTVSSGIVEAEILV